MTLREITEKYPESLNSNTILKGYISDYMKGESKGYSIALNLIIDNGIFDAMKKAGSLFSPLDELRYYLVLTEDYALSESVAKKCLKDVEESLGISIKSIIDSHIKETENAKNVKRQTEEETLEAPGKEKNFEEQPQGIMSLTKFQLWQRAIPLLPGESEEEYWKRVNDYLKGLYTDAYNLAMNGKNKGDGNK